jgi:hypothetical protein
LAIETGEKVEVICPRGKFSGQATVGGQITGVRKIDLVIGHCTLLDTRYAIGMHA